MTRLRPGMVDSPPTYGAISRIPGRGISRVIGRPRSRPSPVDPTARMRRRGRPAEHLRGERHGIAADQQHAPRRRAHRLPQPLQPRVVGRQPAVDLGQVQPRSRRLLVSPPGGEAWRSPACRSARVSWSSSSWLSDSAAMKDRSRPVGLTMTGQITSASGPPPPPSLKSANGRRAMIFGAFGSARHQVPPPGIGVVMPRHRQHADDRVLPAHRLDHRALPSHAGASACMGRSARGR